MKPPDEKHAEWATYAAGLPWVKGELDVASWWTFLRAASCGVTRSEALGFVENRIRAAGGAVRPAKLESQCRRAFDHVGTSPDRGSTWSPRPGWSKPVKPKFDDTKLKTFAAEWSPHVDAVWLGNRSTLDPALVTAGDFMDALYDVGESVLLFSEFQSQGQMFWHCFADRWLVGGADTSHDYTHNFDRELSGPEGVWFLANPVDGEMHANPRETTRDGRVKMSRRSQESVTSWRYLVLESDEAKPRDWLGALVQLPLRIVAIYTSGGRSIHALVRIDAGDKSRWDAERDAMAPALVTLGGDPAALTAVRLTRLPGCHRSGKLQKLLYLNPKASGLLPICALPPKRDVVGIWSRQAEGFNPDEGDLAMVQRGLAHYAPVCPVLAERLKALEGNDL